MKALKFTISGSYRTATGDVVDFEDVGGTVPCTNEEIATMHVRGRYAVMWLKSAKDDKGEKLYKARIDDLRQVFIDDFEEVDRQFNYTGKNIKEMSFEELQDLATAKDLRKIQLPKELSGVSLREMRETAYLEYSEHVLRDFIDKTDAGYNYAKLPDLVVDGNQRTEKAKSITNDEVIEQEQSSVFSDGAKSDLTLNDLKQIADAKNIKYHPAIGFDALYSKLYSVF